jgi:hypothetical protein
VAAALLLGGCTAQDDRVARPDDSSAAASGSSGPRAAGQGVVRTPTEAPSRPPARGCYRLDLPELTDPSSTKDPVDCGSRHSAQTIHVGRLDTVVEGHAVAVTSDHVREQLARTCPRRMARFLGGGREERRLTRFEVVWFGPTLAHSDAGSDWFRCDVVALAGQDRLLPLPPPRRLRGVLDREGALATYGLCGTAAPGSPDFSRVICDRPHRWRAISTIPLTGGDAYPGEAAVRAAGDEACRQQAVARAEDPLQFRYGWEWPSAEQWAAGQRYGYCWVPD